MSAKEARRCSPGEIRLSWKAYRIILSVSGSLAWQYLVATGRTKQTPSGRSALRVDFRDYVKLRGAIIREIRRKLIEAAAQLCGASQTA